MFLIPLGIILKNKYLLTFSFYIAPLGALMALLFPDTNFINNNISLEELNFLIVCIKSH